MGFKASEISFPVTHSVSELQLSCTCNNVKPMYRPVATRTKKRKEKCQYTQYTVVQHSRSDI